MTILLNSPNCPSCDGQTVSPTAGIIPYYAMDAGRLSLVVGVPQTVTFTRIVCSAPTEWAMPKPECLNIAKEGVPFDITEKTNTGFTVVATAEDCTFEYFCIKIYT